MNRIVLPISLQDQYAWSFRILQVDLDGFRAENSSNQIFDEDPIGCKLVVPMIRYADLSRFDKLRNSSQEIAHERILTGG